MATCARHYYVWLLLCSLDNRRVIVAARGCSFLSHSLMTPSPITLLFWRLWQAFLTWTWFYFSARVSLPRCIFDISLSWLFDLLDLKTFLRLCCIAVCSSSRDFVVLCDNLGHFVIWGVTLHLFVPSRFVTSVGLRSLFSFTFVLLEELSVGSYTLWYRSLDHTVFWVDYSLCVMAWFSVILNVL